MPVPSLNQWSVIDFYPSWVVPLGSGDNCYISALLLSPFGVLISFPYRHFVARPPVVFQVVLSPRLSFPKRMRTLSVNSPEG